MVRGIAQAVVDVATDPTSAMMALSTPSLEIPIKRAIG
ncbi:hypothetical protein M2317_001632 [Microbacterium sp. ZKA21]